MRCLSIATVIGLLNIPIPFMSFIVLSIASDNCNIMLCSGIFLIELINYKPDGVCFMFDSTASLFNPDSA